MAFEKSAMGTLFQSWIWCSTWEQTAAREMREAPLILTARKEKEGDLLFLLPMAVTPFMQNRVLTWLAQNHNSYNGGLYSEEFFLMDVKDIMQKMLDFLWQERPEIDAAMFRGQAEVYGQLPNPFAGFEKSPAAHTGYFVPLEGGFEKVYQESHSAKTRRRQRQKLKKLKNMGNFSVHTAQNAAERVQYLETFLKIKSESLERQNIHNPFSVPAIRSFFLKLAEVSPSSVVSPFQHTALQLDENIISVSNGFRFQDTFYGLGTATSPGAHSRHSPGQMLDNLEVEALCQAGVSKLDFGPGEGESKQMWKPVPLHRFDSFIPRSFKGRYLVRWFKWQAAFYTFLQRNPEIKKKLSKLKGYVRGLYTPKQGKT